MFTFNKQLNVHRFSLEYL